MSPLWTAHACVRVRVSTECACVIMLWTWTQSGAQELEGERYHRGPVPGPVESVTPACQGLSHNSYHIHRKVYGVCPAVVSPQRSDHPDISRRRLLSWNSTTARNEILKSRGTERPNLILIHDAWLERGSSQRPLMLMFRWRGPMCVGGHRRTSDVRSEWQGKRTKRTTG